MSDKKSLDYIVSRLAYGFKIADKERREPAVVTEFVSLQDLAKRVGSKALERLKEWAELDLQEDEAVPFITLQGGGRKLGVAVINPEDVVQFMEDGILPTPEDLAYYSAGLVRNLVLAGQHALVEFRRPREVGEALLKAARFGARLHPQVVEFIGTPCCILTWYEDAP
jgi:hypothetical protein